MKYFTALAATVVLAATGCSVDSAGKDDNAVNVVVGYQSKTINTVTAGTLLRAQGYLEHRLDDIGAKTGKKYHVEWQDYDTGAPITAQMVAEKIDIGSMGDYPMLINGSKTQSNERAKTELVAATGLRQANVSQHLTLLRQRGIVTTRRAGTTVHYALAYPEILEACAITRTILLKQLEATSVLVGER